MKRISYLFFAVAMVLTVTNGLVSCKDYEEDLRSEQKATQSILDELKNKVEGANGLIEQLEQMKQDLENLENQHEADIENLRTELGNLSDKHDQDIANLRAEFEAKLAALAQIYATKEELANAVADLQQQIDDTNAAINTAVGELEAEDQKLWDALAALEAKLCENCACAEKIAELSDKITALEEWKVTIESWQTEINEWKAEIIVELTTITEELAAVKVTAESALTQANLNKTTLEDYKKLIDANKDSIEDHEERIKEIEDQLKDTSVTDGLKKEIDKLNSILETILGKNNTAEYKTLPELTEEVKKNAEEFKEDIAEIRKEIADLKKELEDKIQANTDRILGIEHNLAHLITDVIIQATHNPIFGSFALPTNTNSNVLAAYYGEIPTAVEFPTARPAYYVGADKAFRLKNKDIQMLGYGSQPEVIPAGTAVSNAGKIYLTINPTNVDFTGTKFALVNSLDEVSGVDITEPVASTHKLSFGWNTRQVTNASNGFYEAEATIKPENVNSVKARVDLNGSELKETIKDVLNPRDGIDVSNIVSLIYNNMSDVLDANALKATWQDNDGNDVSVYSKYAIAATAVNALSYNFLYGKEIDAVPGFDRAEDLINRAFNKISVEIQNAIPTFDLDSYKFTELKKVELSASGIVTATAKIEFTFTIGEGEAYAGQTVVIKDGDRVIQTIVIDPNKEVNKEIKEEVEVEVDITDMLDDIEGDINSFVESINNDLQEINDLLDELNELNEISGKVDNSLADIKARIIKELRSLENRILRYVKSPNKALQPVMLVNTSDSFTRMSQVQKAPTRVNSTEVTLYPTSYTAEILAPAYKKLVGLTNVYSMDYNQNAQAGDTECLAELQNVNGQENVAKVVDGTTTAINVSLKKGYVYEFAYTAVDYNGKVVAKKCYITVQ